MDAGSNLYGATQGGGENGGGSGDFGGTIFKLTSTVESSTLWNLGGTLSSGALDGQEPAAGVIRDASGDLYGVTTGGGTFNSGGTLFELAPPAGGAAQTTGAQSQNSWTETVLWNFGCGADGQNPTGVVMDANGNFFGTTAAGGTNRAGTVFEVTATGQESILWNFGAGADGQSPNGIIMDSSGNLYGTTTFGGIYNLPLAFCTSNGITVSGCGTAFELTPPAIPGGDWTETILWNFGNGADGAEPISPLLLDASGNLFGTTAIGGNSFFGTALEISNLSAASSQILLSSQHLQFPNTPLGQISTIQLGVRNTGAAQLTGSIAPPSAPFGLKGSSAFNLAPKTSATITLTFTPTQDARAHGTTSVSSNSTKHPTVTLDLRGSGIPAPSPNLAMR